MVIGGQANHALTEIWAPVRNHEGVYDVSADGQVMRVRYSLGSTPGRVLKPHVTRDGYHQVRLYTGARDRSRWHKVHRLVADAFLGPCPIGYQVNHIDGDKGNNAVSNLEYVTAKQNIIHAERLGLRPKRRGERHPMARLTAADVREIRRMSRAGHLHQRAIAARFGISESHAHRIIQRRAWRYLED